MIATALLYGLAGLLLGAALTSPHLALCAWLAVAALGVALGRTRSAWAAAGGTFVSRALVCAIAFPWMRDGNLILFDYSPRGMAALYVGEVMLLCIPYTVAFGVGHRLCSSRLAARFWVPIAWAGGELLSYAMSSVCVDDWLNTQWTVTPVLRALAWVGWWPLVLACLFAATSIGEALASRRWRPALPSAAIIIAIGLAPPIRDGKEEHLEGLAAAHTMSTMALPHTVPDGVELLIWSETALDLRPLLAEGPGNGAVLPPLLPWSPVDHLIGLRTALPGGIAQNQAVAVAADGRVIESRAKQLFALVAERRVLGVGRSPFRPGTRRQPLAVADRAIIALICSESLSRELLADGVAGGGELLAILAGEQWLASERALQQFLAIQVLRSVEFGVPSVRASYLGQATFVAADGRVLARSRHGRNGVLAWDRERGAQDIDFRGRPFSDEVSEDPPADIAVLYSESAPHLHARCPEGRCAHYPIESFDCGDERAAAVIVGGHGRPPDYLARPAAEIAAAIRCFEPDLVVVDTCFGASSELLVNLDDLDAVIVAAPTLVSSSGFTYGADFFASTDPWIRAAAVNTLPASELLRWRNDPLALAELLDRVGGMGADELGANLARRNPPTIRVELPAGGPVLVPVAWERLGPRRPAPHLLPPRRPDRR